MRKLIRFALADAENRGAAYSVLFPSNEGLYRFYEKLGYVSRCRVTQTELKREEIGECSELTTVFPDTDELQQLCFQNNFLFWNKELIRFAADYYAVYGVETLYSADALVIAEVENGTATVLYAVYRDLNSLKTLLSNMKAERYRLTLSGGDMPFGMIQPLGHNRLPDNTYIGITLN